MTPYRARTATNIVAEMEYASRRFGIREFDFVDSNFYSASQALEGKLNCRDDWSHPPGSNIVGWVKSYEKSPIVYLQFGDGPSAYKNPSFQKILSNAIRWAASESAREWALSATKGSD